MMFNASIRKPSVARAFAPKARVVRQKKNMTVQAFTVTFQTPDGDKAIEVDEDTMLLDAAEVRPSPV